MRAAMSADIRSEAATSARSTLWVYRDVTERIRCPSRPATVISVYPNSLATEAKECLKV